MLTKINKKFNQEICYWLLIISFAVYLVIMLWLIIFKASLPMLIEPAIRQNIKFPTISERIFKYSLSISVIENPNLISFLELLINLLIFIPLGLYLPLIFKKYSFKRDILLASLLTISIEFIQLFSRLGIFSITDMVYNLISFSIGSFIFFKLRPRTKNIVINYIQLGVVVIFLPLAIYAIINLGLSFDNFSPIFDFNQFPYRW